jgi:NAD(P)-dependent dehydrogenase (short-subunit alcohol dehydrogenase family)
MPVPIVTGSSSGVGQATAIALARKGFVVHAGMRNLDAGAPLSKIAQDENVRLLPIRMDVDDAASVEGAPSSPSR